MQNNAETSYDGIASHGQISAQGLHKYSAVLEVTHNTETDVLGDLSALIKADLDYQNKKAARIAATMAQKIADEKAAAFITVARDNLKPKFGSRYSLVWGKAGFRNNSLAIPRSIGGHLSQVKTLELLFEAEPALETVGAATKLIASDVFAELSTAMEASATGWVEQRQTKALRDAAMKTMRVRLQNLYAELKQLLAKDDPRWLEFGFNVPADVSVPQAPENFIVAPGLPGHLTASWQRPALAQRFRLFRKIIGLDAFFVAVDSLTETTKDLNDMTSGAHVQLYVVAANSAGEGQPSETVEVVVP